MSGFHEYMSSTEDVEDIINRMDVENQLQLDSVIWEVIQNDIGREKRQRDIDFSHTTRKMSCLSGSNRYTLVNQIIPLYQLTPPLHILSGHKSHPFWSNILTT